LYNLIGGHVSTTQIEASETLKRAAKELVAARGNSLVISGSNDPDVQILVNAINSQLGNYGNTIDLSTPIYMRQGDDEAMSRFVEDLKGGKISAVIFCNANPVYDHPKGQEIADALQKVQLTIPTNDRRNETSSLV